MNSSSAGLVWDPRGIVAPPLALTAVDGTRLDLAAERDRAVLIVSFEARKGRIEVRGEPGDWPRYEAFRALRRAAAPRGRT